MSEKRIISVPDTMDLLSAELQSRWLNTMALYPKVDFIALALAHIQIESQFNAWDWTPEKNSTGEIIDFSLGLFQGRLDTARWLMPGWFYFSDKEIMKRLMKQTINVEFGYRMIFRNCKRYYSSDIQLSTFLKRIICAYNAGSVRYTDASNTRYINQVYVDGVLNNYKTFGGKIE